jgi:hypothetical protein
MVPPVVGTLYQGAGHFHNYPLKVHQESHMPTKTRGIYRPRARLYYIKFANALVVVENGRAWIKGGRVRKPDMRYLGYIISHGADFVGYV